MKRFITTSGVVLVGVMGLHGMIAAQEKSEKNGERAFTEDFGEEDADLVATGKNPLFILEPGYELVLEGKEKGHAMRLVVAVTEQTKKIGNVETRIVEERESKDGKLHELSRNYFAISKRTNAVYYFGEDVDIYDEDGKVAKHEGSWQHGKDGARYGLYLPGTPLVGARYYQEIAPRAKDRCEIVSLKETVETGEGKLEGCVKIEETTPVEPDEKEYKLWKANMGLVQDDALTLVKHGFAKKAD